MGTRIIIPIVCTTQGWADSLLWIRWRLNYYNAYGKVEKTKYQSIINKNQVTLSSTADHTQVYNFMQSTEYAKMSPREQSLTNKINNSVSTGASEKQAPGIVKALVGLNPLIAIPNAIRSTFFGKDIYDEKVEGSERVWSAIGLIPLGKVSKVVQELYDSIDFVKTAITPSVKVENKEKPDENKEKP